MLGFSSNEREFRDKLNKLKRSFEHPKPAMTAIGHILVNAINKQFNTKGKEFNTPWAPITPVMDYIRRWQGYNPVVMKGTGALRQSFKGHVSSDGRSVVVGTNLYYARNVHEGIATGKPAHFVKKNSANEVMKVVFKRVTERPVIPETANQISQNRRQEMINAIINHIKNSMPHDGGI